MAGLEPSVWVVVAGNFLDRAPLELWEARKAQLVDQPLVLYSWDDFMEWCISSFSVHNHERHALSQLGALRQTGSVAEYKAAHNVLAAKTSLPMQLRLLWWETGLRDEIRSQVTVDPLTYKEYTDIDKAQSAAVALDAHLKSSSSVAASFATPRNHSRPSTASARAEAYPQQRQRFTEPAPRPEGRAEVRIAKWSYTDGDFQCDREGRLADPLPRFFSDWVASCKKSSLGKPLLPTDLCNLSKQPPNTCFYKGCNKYGHRWDHCPKLAMHVFKNPEVSGA